MNRIVSLRNSGAMLGLSLLATMAGQGAESSLPPAEEVFAAHVRAIGGKPSVVQVEGLRARGRFEIRAQGVIADVEIVRAKPNKQLYTLTFRDIGKVLVGYDGSTGWVVEPIAGARVLEGKMLDQLRDDAEFYSQFQIHDPNRIESSRTIGRTQFEDEPCYEVNLVWRSGRTETLYFNIRSGLLAGTRKQQFTEQGAVVVVNRMSRYRRYGNLLQPTRVRQQMGDTLIEFNLSSYSFETLADSVFDLPPAVKAIVQAAAAPPQ